MSELIDPCYIARKSCGCIAAVIVDSDEESGVTRADVAKFCSKAIRLGETIERVAAEDVRNGTAGKFGCDCKKAPKS